MRTAILFCLLVLLCGNVVGDEYDSFYDYKWPAPVDNATRAQIRQARAMERQAKAMELASKQMEPQDDKSGAVWLWVGVPVFAGLVILAAAIYAARPTT